MEITVISAQGLKNPCSYLFYSHLQPFVTLTIIAPAATTTTVVEVYKTRVDNEGGLNPSWGESFQLPYSVDYQSRSFCIHLQLYTKRLFSGISELGWCRILASDIFDGPGSVRHLSYRLMDKDGSRGHGIVNVAVKISKISSPVPPVVNIPQTISEMGLCPTVIGIPVSMIEHENHEPENSIHVRGSV